MTTSLWVAPSPSLCCFPSPATFWPASARLALLGGRGRLVVPGFRSQEEGSRVFGPVENLNERTAPPSHLGGPGRFSNAFRAPADAGPEGTHTRLGGPASSGRGQARGSESRVLVPPQVLVAGVRPSQAQPAAAGGVGGSKGPLLVA